MVTTLGNGAKLRSQREFRKDILDRLLTASGDGRIERYWLYNACEPRYIAQTKSPVAHVIAENSTNRLWVLTTLRKMYADANDLATFTQIINAKNSRGQTTLDYMAYMVARNKLIKQEEPGVNAFVAFLCENGAVFSLYSGQCPWTDIVIEK